MDFQLDILKGVKHGITAQQVRQRAWRNETTETAAVPAEAMQDITSYSRPAIAPNSENAGAISLSIPKYASDTSNSLDDAILSASWLCPIASEYQRRGILQMNAAEYFELVDKSGRMIRSDKRGAIDADLAPILLRIGVKPDSWADTVSRFGSQFHLAAGFLSNLRHFANQLGRRWIQGVAAARASFALSPPRMS
jgi:hypothetical protein